MPDPHIFITGACGNLGRAVTAYFAAHGARLSLLDRNPELLHAVYGAGSATQHMLAVDLLDAQAVAAAAQTAIQRFGTIDALCNLAGGFRMGPAVHETSDAQWDFLMDINVRSLLHAARAVVPHMLKAGGGKIVNIGAAGGLRGTAGTGAYAASKSAVARLTESMSAELRARGIRVNCILPTTIDTPENRAAMPEVDPSDWVQPGDLAEVVGFLCSHQARAIHGACITV